MDGELIMCQIEYDGNNLDDVRKFVECCCWSGTEVWATMESRSLVPGCIVHKHPETGVWLEPPKKKQLLTPETENCCKCGGKNIIWFAPNELWNRVMRKTGMESKYGIICIHCFVEIAESNGVKPTAWILNTENL